MLNDDDDVDEEYDFDNDYNDNNLPFYFLLILSTC